MAERDCITLFGYRSRELLAVSLKIPHARSLSVCLALRVSGVSNIHWAFDFSPPVQSFFFSVLLFSRLNAKREGTGKKKILKNIRRADKKKKNKQVERRGRIVHADENFVASADHVRRRRCWPADRASHK